MQHPQEVTKSMWIFFRCTNDFNWEWFTYCPIRNTVAWQQAMMSYVNLGFMHKTCMAYV